MAQNIDQIYTVNPSTTVGANDLFYLGISPYGPTDDSAIKWSNLVVSIAAEVAGGSTTEIQYNNAGALDGDTGFTTDGAGTLSAVALALTNALPVTSGGTGLSSTTANQLLYSSATSTVAGLATANNGLLVTSAAGVPSIGNDILADITVNGITVGKGAFDTLTNTAVGKGALDAATSSVRTTAIGFDTLGALLSGNDNTAVGASNQIAITTGIKNTSVGQQAMYSAGSGSSGNTAIGYYSMLCSGGGALTSNTAVGQMTLSASAFAATGNTAVGSGAMAPVTTGALNVGVGYSTLANLTTGSQNAALGRAAGAAGATGAVGLVTGSNNTFAGWLASSDSSSASGTIALGANAVSTIATGATSGDDGPGIAIGSAAYPVGFRGDATIYPTAGTISGYMIQKINGVQYKVALYALS